MGDEQKGLRDSYNTVAQDYVAHVVPVSRKPFDCALLDQFAARLVDQGPVWDLGCGPGDVTRYLSDRELDVIGVDLSEGMLDHARKLNPDITFQRGDMLALDAADDSLAGLTAFYSLIHFQQDQLARVAAELHRVLRPGGLLLIALHGGDGQIHLDEWWGRPVQVDTYFHTRDGVEKWLRDSGFSVDDISTRPPYPEIEYPSERIYALARK